MQNAGHWESVKDLVLVKMSSVIAAWGANRTASTKGPRVECFPRRSKVWRWDFSRETS